MFLLWHTHSSALSQISHAPHVPNTTTFAGVSDIGRTRSRNEDSFALRPVGRIAVVADGMGGHPSGDVASRIAATRTADTLEARLGSGLKSQGGLVEIRATMSQCVMSAHHAIRDACARGEDLEGMGTTLTAMAFDLDGKAYVLGHVGDSRAYRLRADVLDQLTPDDTWVQASVDANELTPEQAKRHPFGHILTQCVGLADPPTHTFMTEPWQSETSTCFALTDSSACLKPKTSREFFVSSWAGRQIPKSSKLRPRCW